MDPTLRNERADGTSAAGLGFAASRQTRGWAAQRSAVIPVLCAVTGIGALISSLTGLLGAPNPTPAVSTRGGSFELFGGGIYHYDSLFAGAGNRGADAVTLLVALPLLAVSVWRLRRGSQRWHLALVGLLGYFVYAFATMAIGTALNQLFLVYVTVFAAALWALLLAVTGLDFRFLAGQVDRFPRRGIAVFLIASGAFTVVVWCAPVLLAQLSGDVPARLDGYTTMVTAAIDTAVVAPAAVMAGTWVWRRRLAGYLLAVPLLVLETMLAPLIAAQSISQLLAGVTLAPNEIVGPTVGFGILAVVAGILLSTLMRAVPATDSVIRCAASPDWEITTAQLSEGTPR